jgi:PTS system nitrogen regulatory IIA component
MIMNIASLLTVERIDCASETSSKKRLLEMLADMLATVDPELTASSILESLLHRERLGSTGIGHGVAIPHGRLAGIDQAFGAFITLKQGIDYDAPDHQPVDLLFALIVPEQSTEEHLQILATLAQSFSDKETSDKLRQCRTSQDILNLTRQWTIKNAAA